MGTPAIVVQARMGSSRLPGKVMADLAGAPVLARLFERLRSVRGALLIVLATSTLPSDDVIADYVSATPDIKLWRGPEHDVLKRYADAARFFDLDPIVRLTADNPLIDAACVDSVLNAFRAMPGCQYADNLVPRRFPHGYSVQVVSRATLDWLDRNTSSARDREHVLIHIQDHPTDFKSVHVTPDGDAHPELRVTVDYPEDLVLVRTIFQRLYPSNPHFSLKDILALHGREPDLFETNTARKNC